jgi:hypothetical protein
MNKPLFILGLCLCLCHAVLAQWPLYRVYQTQGTVRCRKGDKSAVLVRNTFLYNGDILVLEDNARVTLFDQQTNYIRLVARGTYTMADVQKLQKTPITDNITVKYCTLLWQELLHPGGEQAPGSVAGVSRGLAVVLFPASGYKTSVAYLPFVWNKIAWAEGYRLTVGHCTLSVGDTTALLDIKDSLHYGAAYHWTLSALRGGNARTVDTGRLVLVDESAVPPVPVGDTLGGLLDGLRRCEWLEHQGCIAMASGLYRALMVDNLRDTALQILYTAFIERNHL